MRDYSCLKTTEFSQLPKFFSMTPSGGKTIKMEVKLEEAGSFH